MLLQRSRHVVNPPLAVLLPYHTHMASTFRECCLLPLAGQSAAAAWERDPSRRATIPRDRAQEQANNADGGCKLVAAYRAPSHRRHYSSSIQSRDSGSSPGRDGQRADDLRLQRERDRKSPRRSHSPLLPRLLRPFQKQLLCLPPSLLALVQSAALPSIGGRVGTRPSEVPRKGPERIQHVCYTRTTVPSVKGAQTGIFFSSAP